MAINLCPEAIVNTKKILKIGDIPDFIENLPDGEDVTWKINVLKQIEAHLRHEDFPCIFARKVMAERYLMMAFVNGWQNTVDLDHFCDCVTDYTKTIKPLYEAAEICPPLMVVFKPSNEMDGLHHYANISWYILQYLHFQDTVCWPDHIPTDPNDPLWSFCFNGFELFFNITSPLLGKHKSRVLSDSLIFTIQPRPNFDIVAGKNTPFGPKVREKIRERWLKYDGLEKVSNLSMYGDAENSEWRQYFLYSDDFPAPPRCPLNITTQNKQS